MKKIKIFFIALFFCHAFITLNANLHGLGEIDAMVNHSKINSFANSLIFSCKNISVKKNIKFFQIYGGFTGTNRGYEFYSPNVRAIKNEFLFFSNKGKIIKMPFNSRESQLKFNTSFYYLQGRFKDKNVRDEILKSISARLFSLNKDISYIDVYFKNTYFDDIPNNDKNIIKKADQIFAFRIKK